MKKIDCSKLQPGDVVLTTSLQGESKLIRWKTDSDISQAMLCVASHSVMDSKGDGVHARNPQKLFYDDECAIHGHCWLMQLLRPLARMTLTSLKPPSLQTCQPAAYRAPPCNCRPTVGSTEAAARPDRAAERISQQLALTPGRPRVGGAAEGQVLHLQARRSRPALHPPLLTAPAEKRSPSGPTGWPAAEGCPMPPRFARPARRSAGWTRPAG